MSIDAYLNPEFTPIKKLLFLIVTAIAVGICIFLIWGFGELAVKGCKRRYYRDEIEDMFINRCQRFFEMLISGTSVMAFSVAYVVINHVCHLVDTNAIGGLTEFESTLVDAWNSGKDFILLLLICISCVINTLLDSLLIPLTKISKEEKAINRMLAMFYVIIILMFLNLIGDESQYSPVMMYYFGLMVGRFVYFDASFMDFIHALKNMFLNVTFLLMNLVLTGLLCLFGFRAEFFLERNYYIVGVFKTQLFVLFVVFIIHLISMIKMHRSGN